MTVQTLDHVNIRTNDLAATLAFFRDALALHPTPPPGSESVADAAWLLDAQGHAVLHVATANLNYPTDREAAAFSRSQTGALHHVALNCSGYEIMRERMMKLGLELVENDVPSVGLRQLFVIAPDGILFELNFREG